MIVYWNYTSLKYSSSSPTSVDWKSATTSAVNDLRIESIRTRGARPHGESGSGEAKTTEPVLHRALQPGDRSIACRRGVAEIEMQVRGGGPARPPSSAGRKCQLRSPRSLAAMRC